MSGMTVQEAFREMSRIINEAFPPGPDTGYVGKRCGWYPEKPRRKRRVNLR